MSKALLVAGCKAAILVTAMAVFSSQWGHAQPRLKMSVPPPNIPMLNNASLQTTVNPNSALPNQVPFIYIAGLPQDCRLNLNGVQIWTPRLDSMCFQLQVQGNMGNAGGQNMGQNVGQNIGQNVGQNIGQNIGGNPGMIQGFGAARGNPLGGYGYPGYYNSGYDASRGYMGAAYGGNVSRSTQPFTGYNFSAGNAAQTNFFSGATPDTASGFSSLANFGGDSNPFNSFKSVKPDANDDKEKNDKEKKEAGRKEQDADKQR